MCRMVSIFFFQGFRPYGVKNMPFPYMARKAPKSQHTSNRSFQTNRRRKVRVKFSEYSASRENLLQPDIAKYDKDIMTKSGFGLILGSNTMKELGIVIDFWTKEITLDDISLPMRDINKLNS